MSQTATLESVADKSPEQRFARLAAQWKAETTYMSSITDMSMHSAYQQIIGMGPAVLPLILRELDSSPHQWFWALKAITGQDPVPAASRGRVTEMAECWLRWAREQGYRW